ncbi:hypothetical protein L3X38_028735 [Prunus dulcis]|uniref:Uncharacterized protein n=1 Tax=Prunus dulcis TaxID=3755 RepID=A0AAD4VRQ1_PRUDU|nr:hypothetical protein L3X38_028735 [Prunus dulcis]
MITCGFCIPGGYSTNVRRFIAPHVHWNRAAAAAEDVFFNQVAETTPSGLLPRSSKCCSNMIFPEVGFSDKAPHSHFEHKGGMGLGLEARAWGWNGYGAGDREWGWNGSGLGMGNGSGSGGWWSWGMGGEEKPGGKGGWTGFGG